MIFKEINKDPNLYFNKDDLELEKEGWIKVFRSVESGEPIHSQNWVSAPQRIWLKGSGSKTMPSSTVTARRWSKSCS